MTATSTLEILCIPFMSKRYIAYKILLHLLQGLVFAKRFAFWTGKQLWKLSLSINSVYKRSIGFYLYKAFFYTGKFVGKHFLVHRYSKFEVLGQRGALQLAVLLVAFFVMFPQSKLYSKEFTHVPGRETLLYKLIGPGDQDFELQEVTSVASSELVFNDNAASWKEGAVMADAGQGLDSSIESQELAGISVGGSAITKTIIAPSVDVRSLAAEASATDVKREKVIEYEVKPGDVVGNIAKLYNVSVDTILVTNNLTARSYIRPGDKLKILPVDGITYKIEKGDTISKIAKRFEAKPEDIIAFNKLKDDGSDIVIGEELILPGGRQPVPVKTVIVRNTQPSRAFNKIVAPPVSINVPAGSGYIWPTAARIITQYFGLRHTGLDIAGPVGTPIYAMRGGTVIKSQCGYNGGYGCYIIIDHGNGLQTLYGHNSKLYVSPGQTVSQGEVISLMGSTGRSTGPHVHFEVRVNGRRVNPLQYVRR